MSMKYLEFDISNKKQQLLDLLDNWYYLHTDVKARIIYTYDNIFGDIEETVSDKKHEADFLDRKYHLLSYLQKHNKKIASDEVAIIDNMLNKGKLRDIEIAQSRTSNKAYQSRFHPFNFNRLLDTAHNDKYDISMIYRQIVKQLHPDAATNSEYHKYWNHVQLCYRFKDIERLKMFFYILHNRQYSDGAQTDTGNSTAADLLQKYIEKQNEDIANLKMQEPFCFEHQLSDATWVVNRKRQLREQLMQLNKSIMQNRKLIASTPIYD